MTVPVTPRLVVVVDDVEANRELAQATLEMIGWDVRSFSTGADALAFLDQATPQAMLLDVRMPGMSGGQLLRILRERPATRALRVIAYTAHALPDEIASFMASGFDDVLIKPARVADMRRVLPRPAPPGG
jgi:CheY-like chemotaxis protein